MNYVKPAEWQQRVVRIDPAQGDVHRQEKIAEFLHAPGLYGRQDHEARLRSHGGFGAPSKLEAKIDQSLLIPIHFAKIEFRFELPDLIPYPVRHHDVFE